MSAEVLLAARDLARTLDKHMLWRDISFEICRGDILFVRGPSGVGKTLLLRTLACLDPIEVSCCMHQAARVVWHDRAAAMGLVELVWSTTVALHIMQKLLSQLKRLFGGLLCASSAWHRAPQS